MTRKFEVRRLMQDDEKQDSFFINDLLKQVHSILSERKQLSKHINYDLSERGAGETKCWEKLINYTGPDDATLKLLTDHAHDWFEDPSKFWNPQQTQDLSNLPAVAQIIGCFLRKWEKQNGPVKPTLDSIAPYLKRAAGHSQEPTQQDVEKLSKDVDRMVHMGSRYLNLEKSLTAGVTLCLGTNISESHWSKRLPKSGKKHGAILDIIRNTSVSGLALKYTDLRMKLVKYQLQALRAANPTPLISPIANTSPLLGTEPGLSSAAIPIPNAAEFHTFNSDYVAADNSMQDWGL